MARDMTTRSITTSLAAVLTAFVLAGCAGDPGAEYARERDAAIKAQQQRDLHGLPFSTEQDSIDRVLKADHQALDAYRRASRAQAQNAYRAGVKDTMSEFRGRLNAQRGFVWRKPLVDTVRMPSRVVNGALVPAHMEPVIIAPGQWQERNSIMLPDSPYDMPNDNSLTGGYPSNAQSSAVRSWGGPPSGRGE